MTLFLRASALAVLLALAPSALSQDLAPRVFPNPISAERAVTVEVADASAATLEVVDVLGRRLAPEAGLAAGTYLVRAVYADGRASEPTPVTVATPGPVEFRLVSPATAAAESAAPMESAPVTESANAGIGCADGDVTFGGFQHTANLGGVRLRPELVPPSMRVNPPSGSSNSSFTTCLGEVLGWSFRYIAGGDAGNRPLRVLSPAIVGNTQAQFTTNYMDFGPAKGGLQFVHGTAETFLDHDNDPGTASIPSVEAFAFDGFTRGGPGGYELIVLDGEEVVFRGIVNGGTYLTPSGPDGRINMLRSILTSRGADGYEVEGGFDDTKGGIGKPGDLSAVMGFESGDGSDVNVYIMDSTPGVGGGGTIFVGSGDAVHLTPYVYLSGEDFAMTSVTTDVFGANRFGVRAFQFAAGGQFGAVRRGGGPSGQGQWARTTDAEYLRQQRTDVVDASNPLVFVGGDVERFGLQWGREPKPLQETGSAGIEVYHDGLMVTKGGSAGVRLAEDGQYYRATARVRNLTDVQDETVNVELANVGGTGTSLTVTNENASFSTYTFMFEGANGNTIVDTYNVGDTIVFGPNVVIVDASRSYGQVAVPPKRGIGQAYSVGFLLSNDSGEFGEVTILPDWTSVPADVNTRDFATDANQPFMIGSVQEYDEGMAFVAPQWGTARTATE